MNNKIGPEKNYLDIIFTVDLLDFEFSGKVSLRSI